MENICRTHFWYRKSKTVYYFSRASTLCFSLCFHYGAPLWFCFHPAHFCLFKLGIIYTFINPHPHIHVTYRHAPHSHTNTHARAHTYTLFFFHVSFILFFKTPFTFFLRTIRLVMLGTLSSSEIIVLLIKPPLATPCVACD